MIRGMTGKMIIYLPENDHLLKAFSRKNDRKNDQVPPEK